MLVMGEMAGLERDDNDTSVVEQKLHAFNVGGNIRSPPRVRTISYVVHGGGGGRSSGGGGGGGRPGSGIADLVVLNEYDDDGKLAQKGTCIVRGVLRKFVPMNQARNPMKRNKDGSDRRVEMQYEIVDDECSTKSSPKKRVPLCPQKDFLGHSEGCGILLAEPLAEVSADEIPQPSERPSKSMTGNAPPTSTRSEATSYMETHKHGKTHKLDPTAHGDKIISPKATFVDFHAANKANSAFQERLSFKARENVPMSERRALARQAPALQRVRHKPAVRLGITASAVRSPRSSPTAAPSPQVFSLY